jgi:hypothetical protein
MKSGMLPNASPCAFVIVSLKEQSQPCKAAIKNKAVEMSVLRYAYDDSRVAEWIIMNL